MQQALGGRSSWLSGALLLAVVVLLDLVAAEPKLVPHHATIVSRASSNYTFVIAGGGIAGLTLADRLTEDPSGEHCKIEHLVLTYLYLVTVLVIEAGPFDQGQDGILVPGAFAPYLYFWPNLVTAPQVGLDNRVFPAVCAQVVGGGSTINAMVYLRGTIVDYSQWEALGNPGWGWADLLPYFLKSENYTRPAASLAREANISWDETTRGHSGPVKYSYPNYFYPGSANWWNAAKSAGLPPIQDPNNGREKQGIFAMPSLLDAPSMTRSSARRNHFDRVAGSRPNYHILASNTVSKVLFRGKQAVGVNYLATGGGEVSSVYATKEIILAAGALHTPQILQLSGIGPKKLLKKFKITVISDLPGVGQNLQDQSTLTIPYTFTANLFPNSNSIVTNATYNAEQRALYDAQNPSAYSIISTISTNIASLSLQDTTTDYKKTTAKARAQDPARYLPKDIDRTVLEGYKAQRRMTLKQFEHAGAGIGNLHWGTANNALIYHLKPLSRGYVAINSTDPLAAPLIDFRSATDPTDIALYVALFRKNRQIFSQPSMQVLGPTEISPFGEQLQTDEQIANVMRQTINPSNSHQCCTAAMLPRKLGGVVSNDHKVYGVRGLRVADISFWPMEISAAPTATMYAAGEKLADSIKDEYCLDGHC
ncbi:oxygen-dependent choline dehydrogenase [Rhypophila decipiens]|uniref:Oxygen-dependent choline dehydrogenase n=1 Tax=Rhypophila decipiens TaxID=261697 RepID=A0AAN6XY11_9PEZI|nr:oxygen-dependent choline dehydrogenase [Rhypophila decipiens]